VPHIIIIGMFFIAGRDNVVKMTRGGDEAVNHGCVENYKKKDAQAKKHQAMAYSKAGATLK